MTHFDKLDKKIPFLSNKVYEKMVDNGEFDNGFAIPLGDPIMRGNNIGKTLACIKFNNKNAFESFFSPDNLEITKYDGIKWQDDTNLESEDKKIHIVMYIVAFPLLNKSYHDIGVDIVGKGLLYNPKIAKTTDKNKDLPPVLDFKQTKALVEFMTNEYEFGW